MPPLLHPIGWFAGRTGLVVANVALVLFSLDMNQTTPLVCSTYEANGSST